MPTETPVQTVTVPGPRRAITGLIWGLIQAVTVLAGVFAGGAAAAGLDQAATGRAAAPAAVLAGLATGAAAGLLTSGRARSWLQDLRLRRLRSAGSGAAGSGAVSVRATIDRLDRPHRPARYGLRRGRYVVHLSWLDPAAGVGFRGERHYRVAGRHAQRLEALCAGRAQVAVYYPARRPSRFIIDVPFVPTMADFFG